MISEWTARIKGINWRSEIEGSLDNVTPYFNCQNEKRVRQGPHDAVDPVHQHENGLWWFNDETWSDEFGGYVTEQECRDACSQYAKGL
jgi:hypothetical protein